MPDERKVPEPLRWTPPPEPVTMQQGYADLPDARLWHWDTGGTGEAIVFIHPAASGDAQIWRYQIPVFARAGFRVIAYARRGYHKSDRVEAANPGCAAEDLAHLIDMLGLGRAHLVSSGGGGSVAADHALSYPEQVLSLTVSSNYAGVRKGYIRDAARRARPAQWNELPRWFREFSTSSVVANPQGIAEWIAVQDEATKAKGVEQHMKNVIDEAKLAEMKPPTLLLTGDADSSTPPSLMRMLAKHIPDVELKIVPEAGHSPYWETPDIFNRSVLDFVKRYNAT